MKHIKLIFCTLYILFLGYMLTGILGFNVLQSGFQIISVCLYIYMCFYCYKNKSFNLDILCLAVLLLAYNTGLIVGKKCSEPNYMLNVICCYVVVAATIFSLILNIKKIRILEYIKQNWTIFVLISLFVIFSWEAVDVNIMWDARVYYSFPYGTADIQGMVDTFESNFHNFYNMYLAGHSAVGYSLWLMLFQMINRGYMSVQVADIVLAAISIYAYYCIIKKITPSWGNITAAVATTPFAFSPFVLGMVGNINVDSITMYFFVIFIACALYKMECMKIVLATALCFTKETAVIYFFAYVVGQILVDFISNSELRFKWILKVSFGKLQNYLYAIPVILWCVCYYLNPTGGWGNGENTGIAFNNQGMHCFGINAANISSKLKQIFLLNFNWIFWSILVISLALILMKKARREDSCLQYFLPFFTTGLSIIIFGIIYITCTHARYIVPLIPCLYLCSIVLLRTYKRALYVFSFIMGSFLLVQSFTNIDPVMKISFPSINVGETNIYSMHEANVVQFHDSIIYNRQYQYWSETLDKVLHDSGYNGDMLIVLPDDINCGRYNLFGDHFSLWDTKAGKMEYYNEALPLTEHQKYIQIVQVSEADDTPPPQLYIIPKWGTINKEFLDSKAIIKSGNVSWKGYIVEYYVLS